ncbi:MAG TPA: HlyD family secretion protein [Xanthomonadales bacterium]|nr:HlyD family secretion protein [Xanthomonadales bacterium]
MSQEQEQSDNARDSSEESSAEATATPKVEDSPANSGKDPVRRWTLVVLIVTVLLVIWYLRSDRITPYTSQARVHALVVPVAAEVSGRVTSVEVKGNQAVKAGDVLFELETESYQLAVNNAEAALESARQATGASESTVEAAEAGVKAAQASLLRSKQDADRMRAIRKQDSGAISERRVESAEASLAVAQSQLEAAKADLEKAKRSLGGVGDENSQVQQALAALNEAKLNLERTRVRAPTDGVVTDVRVDKGNFAGAGAAQMTFISTSKVWVEADFTENNLGHVEEGDRAELVFDVLPGQVIEGTVKNIGFGVDVDTAPLGKLPNIQNDQTWLRSAQRFPVVVSFQLPDQADARLLKVGSQVSVVVYTGEHWLFNPLAEFYIRLNSILTYAY